MKGSARDVTCGRRAPAWAVVIGVDGPDKGAHLGRGQFFMEAAR